MSGSRAAGAHTARASAMGTREARSEGIPDKEYDRGRRVEDPWKRDLAERVLVVGDDRRRIGVLVERLVRSGYTVMQTARTAEAVRLARGYQPVAVLVHARGAAGELRQQLRTDERTRHIPVVTGQIWPGAGVSGPGVSAANLAQA